MIRLLTILFIPIYLAIALKWNVQIHYCGGHVKSLSFFGSKVKSCCGDTEKMPSGCCHDQSFYFDSDNHDFDETVISFLDIDSDDLYVASAPLPLFTPFNVSTFASISFQYEDPPPTYKVPLYVKNCSYLI